MKRLLYRWFSSFSAFQYRLDRRCTRAGSLALGVLGAAVVIGLDTNRTVGYQVFTLVLALVVVSAASSLVFRGRFAVRRILPRFASAVHDSELDLLQVTWDHGVTLYMDLTREDIVGPIGDDTRAAAGIAGHAGGVAPDDD